MDNKIQIETLNIGIKNKKYDAVCFKIPTGSKTAMVTTKNRFAAIELPIKDVANLVAFTIYINSGDAISFKPLIILAEDKSRSGLLAKLLVGAT